MVRSTTTGFDINSLKTEKLERGETYIKHIPAAAITAEVSRKQFRATTNFSGLREMDAVLICVPTPLDEHREPDLSFVRGTAESILPHLRPASSWCWRAPLTPAQRRKLC